MVLVGGILASATAFAFDPSVALRVQDRPARGPAVAERLDLSASNVTSLTLPRTPRIVFQVRVSGPILGGPLADERGRLLVAHGTGRLTEMDERGRTTWTLRINGLIGAPVALGASRVLAATREAELVTVSRAGHVLRREKLPFGELEGAWISAPTRDGGAIVAAGSRYARVDEKGAVLFSGTATAPLSAVFDWRGTTLLVEREGRVVARDPALDPREVAHFPAPVGRVALQGDALYALSGVMLCRLCCPGPHNSGRTRIFSLYGRQPKER
jgi:hypothetical protein